MTEGPRLSEEFLNAFVDNQIDAAEKSRAYPIIHGNEQLNRQVCELRKVSDLVRLAYDEPPAAPKRRPHIRARAQGFIRRLTPLIAPLVLALGIAMGWFLRSAVFTPHKPVPQRTIAMLTVPHLTTKVLFHLASGDEQHMNEVLNEAQTLLAHYHKVGRQAKVEIIADGPGLALLRQRVSPFAARIAQLKQQYPNLIFAACQDTIQALAKRDGIEPHLLPQAIIVPSAIAEIVHLQRRGWTYISV